MSEEEGATQGTSIEISGAGAKKMGKGMSDMAAASKGGHIGIMAEVMMKIMEASGVIQPFSDAFDVILGFFQAGMGDTVKEFYELMFSPENVAIMKELGLLMAELVKIGLVPFKETIKELLPLLQELTPYIRQLTAGIRAYRVAVEQSVEFFKDLPKIIENALEKAVDSVKDGFKDFIEELID